MINNAEAFEHHPRPTALFPRTTHLPLSPRRVPPLSPLSALTFTPHWLTATAPAALAPALTRPSPSTLPRPSPPTVDAALLSHGAGRQQTVAMDGAAVWGTPLELGSSPEACRHTGLIGESAGSMER